MALPTFAVSLHKIETFPATLGEVEGIYVSNQDTDTDSDRMRYDLSGLYLKVLEDLWATDPGLNTDSQYISVDLSQAPGDLTEGEKSAIAWIFSSRHNAQMLTLSYEELTDQGYVKELTFDKGILFCINSTYEQKKSPYSPATTFDARKWRSGDGAIFFNHCQVIRSENGTWKNYKVGDFAIS